MTLHRVRDTIKLWRPKMLSVTSPLKESTHPRSPRARLRLHRRHRSGFDRASRKTFSRFPRRRLAWRHGLAGGPPRTPRRSARAVAGRAFGDHARRQLRARPESACDPGAAHARRDLGLCARRRLSRSDQEAAEGAGAVAGRGLRRRGQGVRRYRRRDGKAAGAGGGTGLAGQAHQPRVARIRLLAVPRRDLYDAGAAARRRRQSTIAAHARPASISARRRRFRRPTSSMRGAAFPISPSRTRARSRTSFAKRSATASMAATIASRSVPGTNSRRPGAKPNSPRATSCARPRSPNWRGSTMPRSARDLQNRRSNASAATASCAMC